MLHDVLLEHVVVHSFSDGSGTVFFNQVTGETLGVSLTAQQLERLVSNGETDTSVQAQELHALSRMLKLPSQSPGKANA
ncbi:hypothetical protein [Alkalimonas amylolytica]|uniref:Uncharacterized protein n=1 Tax=Alkalimonas amylolytica TaxID=152573 RepID=A0A1H4CE56_ALKAM|nr:hypothetical protein [Alkalimonas amylolytica]SEA58745.1 hypothetical protein SAMN04488051_104122 [Alkalimonas amylolytica]